MPGSVNGQWRKILWLMSKIKNIVFDYGAVLVDWDPHHLYDPYFGSREKADWFLTNVCTNEWNFQMDSGKPFAEAIDELISEHPEWEKEIRMYFDRWIGMMGGRNSRDAGAGSPSESGGIRRVWPYELVGGDLLPGA